MVVEARHRDGLERRAFRLAVAAAGCVPVGAGLAGVLLGAGLTGGPSGGDGLIGLDSHVRYLSGLLLGIGLALWATIPAPERHGARWRLLAAIVVLGGLSRLYGVLVTGAPDAPVLFALVMELAVTPALCLWRERLEKLSRA